MEDYHNVQHFPLLQFGAKKGEEDDAVKVRTLINAHPRYMYGQVCFYQEPSDAVVPSDIHAFLEKMDRDDEDNDDQVHTHMSCD